MLELKQYSKQVILELETLQQKVMKRNLPHILQMHQIQLHLLWIYLASELESAVSL